VELLDPAVGGVVPDQQHNIKFVQQPLGAELLLCPPRNRLGPGFRSRASGETLGTSAAAPSRRWGSL
jgi:hypothetical protein